jgi:predicted lipoprotein with Yx(FWY)xxD motif
VTSVRPHGRHRRLGAVAAAAVLAIAGCGDDSADVDDASSEPITTPSDTSTDPSTLPDGTAIGGSTETSGEERSAAAATVAITETDLGPVLADGAGMTLYVFIPDGQGPSTCVDGCLGSWPALIGPADAGEGVDDALLGTATRPDGGGEQVTYNDWPLYYFASDLGPGDTSGQGVGDVWFVIDAAGEAVPSG